MSVRAISLEEAVSQARQARLAGKAGAGETGGKADAPAVRTHSGRVRPGDIFVLLPPNRPGEKGGLDYLPNALDNGAAIIVCSESDGPEALERLRAQSGPALGLCLVPSSRKALGELASAYYGTEDYRPLLVGITGTNGKTTSTYLLDALFRGSGRKVGVIGTIAYNWPGFSMAAPLTTPGCLELHELFSRMRQAGVDCVFMEVSSHALDQERIAGLNFNGALFTNLTQDHLDYHQSMQAYYQAKARFFREPSAGGVPLSGKARAININDWHGLKLFEECQTLPGSAVAFGLGHKLAGAVANLAPGRFLEGRLLEDSTRGLHLKQRFAGREWEIKSPLVGEFNAMNLLGVQAMALALGLPVEDLRLLESLKGIPGRLERVSSLEVSGGSGPGYDAFVDYSHTPDSLKKALIALRDVGFKRIITVFGCGGDRDRGKRPLMGQIACEYADVAVLTSDNPRTEDPRAIMNDVLPGLKNCMEFYQEPDRRRATELAVSLMRPGDALLVAGKGHEDYQIIGKEKIHYSDQEVLREIFRNM